MKRFLSLIVLFFAVAFAIDATIGFGGDYLLKHTKGGQTKMFNDLVMKDNHEVLILGSSRALHHYDTPFLSDSLGLDVYNAGFKGQGIILAEGILEMALKHSEPKLVLFDVVPQFDIYEFLDDDNHRRYLGLLKPYFRVSEIGRLFKDISMEEWYKVHSGMFRYNTSLLTMLSDFLRARPCSNSGYVPLSGIMQVASEDAITQVFICDSLKIRYLERMILLSLSKNISVAMVASPQYGTFDSSIYNPAKELCSRYNVPFLDYYASEPFASHKEWFQEPVHLNATGARRFSEMLIKDITPLLQ